MVTSSALLSRQRASLPAAVRLLVTRRNPHNRRYDAIGLLSSSGDQYRFRYLESATNVPGFRVLVGFPDPAAEYVSAALFPLFSERVLDSSRPDRATYLDALDLTEYATPMEFLARSGGRRAGDAIELLPIPQNIDGRTKATFLVHGVRHLEGASQAISHLTAGQRLNLRPEPTNLEDPNAVLVTDDGTRLGYVPNPLLDYVRTVMHTGDFSLAVVRANAPEVGHHMRLLVALEGAVPAGYFLPW